jgi:cytochrome c553
MPKPWSKSALPALVSLLSLALAACSGGDSSQSGSAPQPAGDVGAGRVLAEQQCKGCHGLDGKGTAPAIPNLAGQRERYLVAALKEYMDGKRSHAALRDMAMKLNDTDARNVASYYSRLPPAPAAAPAATQVSLYEKGRAVAAACAPCHGADGNSRTAGTPNLAGQQPRYFIAAVQEYLLGARPREAAPMHALVRDMNRADLENVAIYFASQTPAVRAAPPFGNPAAGERLTTLCAGCHGPNGVGEDAATPDLASQDPDYLLRSIKAYRSTRRHPEMQRAVAGLSDPDIESIAAFYAVQKSRPAEDGRRLIEDIVEKCNRCHGGKVDNPALVAPIIHGQDRDYLVMALRAYRDNRRQSTAMHTMSLPYSDSVIDSIATVYADQPPPK